MMRDIVILGSTGSIGTQTLEVVRANRDYNVTGLAAGSNVDLIEKQIAEFHPEMVCLWEEAAADELKHRLEAAPYPAPEVLVGMEGLIKLSSECPADIVLTAVVGMVGIRPTLAAIEAGRDIALANKETLVTAGHLIIPAVRKKSVRLLPVDSEHSAIFQCLQGEEEHGNSISRILLTCSGGPFRGRTMEQMKEVTVEDALRHPSWSMGKKITIDSATLANKGLEVMEAGWLFDVPLDKIEVVIQPGSVIHSMVEFADGAVKAQLGTPDMKLPIQYALYYPKRRPLAGGRLDFASLGSIRFEAPDRENFPALDLALRAGKTGGSMPVVFNAANEWAVAEFLGGRLPFLGIAEKIREAMDMHEADWNASPDVGEILAAEAWTRQALEKH
jgi:1-deoxy-D-xylulose-5-phosphate reductoisomerase